MVFFKRWFKRKNKAQDNDAVAETEVTTQPDETASAKAETAEQPSSKQVRGKPAAPKKAAPKKAAPRKAATKAQPEEQASPPEPVSTPETDPQPGLQKETASQPEPEDAVEEDTGWFKRLRRGLGKSSAKITAGLAGIMGKPKLDISDLEDIEDALIMADVGVDAAAKLADGLKQRSYPDGVNAESLASALADEVAQILTAVEKPLEVSAAHKPHVILMVGVNGSGKTTTAGKLAEFFRLNNLKVMLAAADTFRAAAVEQLQIWGQRTGTAVITGEEGSDAAAVAFRALEEATAAGMDVVIIDTAGRLQAKKELMEELAKIHRVIGKQDETAPHDSIIVLDGTVGQNALSQVEAFKEVAGLTGMIVTKLDGSARGGVVVALAQTYGLPIHAIGVGEQKEDLQPFDAVAFAHALAGVEHGDEAQP